MSYLVEKLGIDALPSILQKKYEETFSRQRAQVSEILDDPKALLALIKFLYNLGNAPLTGLVPTPPSKIVAKPREEVSIQPRVSKVEPKIPSSKRLSTSSSSSEVSPSSFTHSTNPQLKNLLLNRSMHSLPMNREIKDQFKVELISWMQKQGVHLFRSGFIQSFLKGEKHMNVTEENHLHDDWFNGVLLSDVIASSIMKDDKDNVKEVRLVNEKIIQL